MRTLRTIYSAIGSEALSNRSGEIEDRPDRAVHFIEHRRERGPRRVG